MAAHSSTLHPAALELELLNAVCGPGHAGQAKEERLPSTEVGEVSGGRVTQQAFEAINKKDSEISNAAMPGTRGDGEMTPKRIPLFNETSKTASLLFLSSGPLLCLFRVTALSRGRQSSTQAQGV